MFKTTLSLEVSDSPNIKVMRLFDTSHYYSDEDVTNYLVEILPVNKETWLTFHVQKGFSLALNSSSLRYRKVNDEADLRDLPDGIYEIRQSIKPNTHTAIHYYHMRITEILNKIQGKMVDLLADKCDISRDEFNKNRDKLREIEEYAKASKWMIEECSDKKKGKELYDWATKLLEVYSNDCQC